jgi:hypothetical protein
MNRLDEAHGLLSGLLNTFATAQSLAVKWEGTTADPSASTYMREWMLPGQFTGHHLGPNAPNAGPLIYQVDVVSAIAGWGAAYGIAKLFFSDPYFCRGQALSNAGITTRVVVRAGQVGPAMREDTKYVLPMSVTFRAYMTI